MNKIGNNNYLDNNPDVFTASKEYASRFSGSAGQYLLMIQEKIINDLLRPYSSSVLLDVGGGHGQLINTYDMLNIKHVIHGTSISSFKYIIRSNSDKIGFIISKYDYIPLKSKSVDIALSVRLLSHVSRWESLIKEMCRVARKAVIIDYPSTKSLNALTPLLFQVKKRIEKNTRTYTSFNCKDLYRCFQDCGFCEIREQAQFFLPMGVHRLGRGNIVFRYAESFFRWSGLTGHWGSPVILRATASTDTVHSCTRCHSK